jgi:hypothetical protein
MACSRAIRALITLWLDAAATAGLCAPSVAQKIDFSGERITLAIATPPGGGDDLYGRLVGRFLGTYLPGHPTVVPQNMPGAGSLIAGELALQVAPRRRHRDRHHAERHRVRESAGQCQRAVRCAPVQLAGQPQRLYGGGGGVARSAVPYRRGSLQQGAGGRRQRAVVRRDRLAASAQSADGNQDQDRARLSGHRRNHPRHGVVRGAGRGRRRLGEP